jgi:hypothetical protein
MQVEQAGRASPAKWPTSTLEFEAIENLEALGSSSVFPPILRPPALPRLSQKLRLEREDPVFYDLIRFD